MQGNVLKSVKSCVYLGSVVSKDGELDEEISIECKHDGRIAKKVYEVLCDKRINKGAKGKIFKISGKTGKDTWVRNVGTEEGARKETRYDRNEDATMDMWCCKVV